MTLSLMWVLLAALHDQMTRINAIIMSNQSKHQYNDAS